MNGYDALCNSFDSNVFSGRDRRSSMGMLMSASWMGLYSVQAVVEAGRGVASICIQVSGIFPRWEE